MGVYSGHSQPITEPPSKKNDVTPSFSSFPTGRCRKSYLDGRCFILRGTRTMNCQEFHNGFIDSAISACIFGCVGNGHVVWLLSSRVQKTTFSTYFLNLATADLGTGAFLAATLILKVPCSFFGLGLSFLITLFFAMYMASLCFLNTIATERCVSVLFPRWYQCRRPKWITTSLSCLTWMLSAAFYVTDAYFLLLYKLPVDVVIKIMFMVDFWVLPLLVAISTSVLLVGLCCRYRTQPPRSLNVLIVLMLLFFLVFGGPCIVVISLRLMEDRLLDASLPCLVISVNSGIKPIFYYLVWKPWKCRSAEPLITRLQRVFQDEGTATDNRELMRVNLPAEETRSVQTALKKKTDPLGTT